MMKIPLLVSVFVMEFLPAIWGQTVMFGPKQVLLDNLDLQYADDAAVAGDFDGDGDIDLASLASGNLLWFQNKGDFTFDTIDVQENVFENVRDVADMNADGIDDLVTTEGYFALDSAHVFTHHEFNFGSFRLIRMARDINADGYADVVVEWHETGMDPVMYWYRNEADTGFTELLLDSQESSYDYATVADYNSDGRMDVIVVNGENKRFLMFRQSASGSLSRVVIPASKDVLDKGVGIADVDNDADMDIISGAPLDFTESLYYLENKTNTFTKRHPVAGLVSVYSLETGDLDGDGDEDIVFIDGFGNYRVGYIINQGIDDWSDPVYLDSYSSFGAFAYQNINIFDTWLHLKDMDHDGKKDIVVSAIPDDEVFWFKNETIFTSTETVNSSSLVLYPQPAADFVHVENLPFQNGIISVYDPYGRQVMRTNIQSHDLLDIRSLSSGVYYYLVSGDAEHPLLSGKLLVVAK